MSLLVLYLYVSIESFSLSSSVNTLCSLLLRLGCYFNINLLPFNNSLQDSLRQWLICNFKYQILFQHLLHGLTKYILFLFQLWSYLYPCSIILFFLQFILCYHTKIDTLIFCWYLILIDLDKSVFLLIYFFSFLLLLDFLKIVLLYDSFLLTK